MSTNTRRDIESIGAQLSEDTESADVIETLVDVIYDLNETVDEQRERLIGIIDDLKETVEQQGKQIDELEDELDEYREHNERDKADIRKFASEKAEEAQTQDATPGGDTEEPTPETSLEQVVALPEHLVDEQLTANQERARFLAKDFEQYSQACPAGRYIDAGDMRRVLRAKEGKCNTNTLRRVREFLDRLGDDAVEIIERHGKTKVVFTDELVARLARLRRCNAEKASNRNRAPV